MPLYIQRICDDPRRRLEQMGYPFEISIGEIRRRVATVENYSGSLFDTYQAFLSSRSRSGWKYASSIEEAGGNAIRYADGFIIAANEKFMNQPLAAYCQFTFKKSSACFVSRSLGGAARVTWTFSASEQTASNQLLATLPIVQEVLSDIEVPAK